MAGGCAPRGRLRESAPAGLVLGRGEWVPAPTTCHPLLGHKVVLQVLAADLPARPSGAYFVSLAAPASHAPCLLDLVSSSPPPLSQVERMCQAERRQLLAFVTSSSALPAGGFAALRGFNGAQHPFTGGGDRAGAPGQGCRGVCPAGWAKAQAGWKGQGKARIAICQLSYHSLLALPPFSPHTPT